MFQVLAPIFWWITHDANATNEVVAFIACIFAIALFFFVRQLRSLNKGLASVEAFLGSGNVYSVAVSALGSVPSTIGEAPVIPGLAIDSIVAQRFAQYYVGLLPPSPGDKTPRASKPAGEAFEPHAMIQEAINLRLVHSIPNVLVGVGLLFTFLGLTAALFFATQGSASNSVADTQASVHGLLDAASFKFTSSLVALLLSIAFLIVERLLLRRYQTRALRLIGKLDRLFPPISIEELLKAQFDPKTVKRNADSLVDSASSMIAQALDPQQGTTSRQLRAFLADVSAIRVASESQITLLTKFGETIATSISNSLDNTIGHRLSKNLGTLDTTISNIGQRMQSANETVLKTLLDEFSEALEERTRESFSAMVNAAGQFAADVTKSGDALKQSIDGMHNITADVTTSGQKGLTLLTQAIISLGELVENSQGASASLSTAAKSLTQSERSASAMLTKLNEAQELASASVSQLGSTVAALDQAMQRNTDAATESSKAFVAKANATYERYKETFSELNDAIRASLLSMTSDVTNVTDALKVVAAQAEQGQSRRVADLEKLVRDFATLKKDDVPQANGHVSDPTSVIPTVRSEI